MNQSRATRDLKQDQPEVDVNGATAQGPVALNDLHLW